MRCINSDCNYPKTSVINSRSECEGCFHRRRHNAINVIPDIPLMRAFSMTEIQHHIGLMSWAKTQPILDEYLIHIPNGGYRHPLEALKLKKMGVKAGVSDLFLAYPNPNYHGLWIELKVKRQDKPRTKTLVKAYGRGRVCHCHFLSHRKYLRYFARLF